MTSSKLTGVLFVVGAFLHVATGTLFAQSEAKPDLGRVRVQLKWLHQFQFAGYYAAVEKGFYADKGLDVELIEGRPELDPVDAVLSGEAQYGVATPELLLAYAEGAPVVVLGVIFQHSPYVILATEQSGITDISQLNGKRVMIELQASELYAYLTREQVSVKDLQILPHSFSSMNLIEGTIDAMSAYSTDEEFTLNAAQVPYYAFSPRSGGVDFYGDLFFTTQSELKNHPKRVQAFDEATIQGWLYAMEHPEEIIDIILEKYPTQKSRAALEFEAAKMRTLMHPDIIPVGYMYQGRWEHIAETYRELGMLKGPLDLKDFIYDLNPRPDYAWAIWTTGITLAIALVALCILLPVWRLNGKLRREVAQRRETEKLLYEAQAAAERANHAKSQFLASVTHDLRTPLNAILGLSEIMLDKEEDADKQDYLKTMMQSGGSLLSLVDELLDLNKIESGRIDLVEEPFLLDDVLDSVAELLSVPSQRKGLELVSWIEPGLIAAMRGDAERLRQILFNLGGNAVKFTDQGSVQLSAAKDKSGWVRLTVQDSGLGIPDEIIDTLFEPFVRASKTKRKEGSGLGLSIVRRMAEAMGGTVEAHNGEDGGAVFTVRLPIIQSPPFLAALEVGDCLDGHTIAVHLKTPLQTQAAVHNLRSMGAEAMSIEQAKMSDCNLLLLDSRLVSDAIEQPWREAGKTVVRMNNMRPLLTRRSLARSIRAKL